MNRKILNLTTAALVLLAAFVSCKKDDGGSDNPSDGASVINATVVNGDNYNDEIAIVKVIIYYHDDDKNFDFMYVIASGKYENGGFKLNLPETVPEKCLLSFNKEYIGGTMSDPETKITTAYMKAYDSQERYIGDFYCENYNIYSRINYIYVDRNVTVKGRDYIYKSSLKYTIEYDCSFIKGWNIIYTVWSNADKWLYTTKKPSVANYKWYYNPYPWKKGSPNDR